MSETNNNIQSDNGVVDKQTTHAPMSTVDIQVLLRLEKFLHPNWRQTVNVDSNQLKGTKVIGLFNLEKLVKPNLWKIRGQLSILPKDTFKYLMSQRRRVQKKLKRQVRDIKKVHLDNVDKCNICGLQMLKQQLLEDKRALLEEILFYKQELEHSYATIQYPEYYTQYPQYQYNEQCYNGYNTEQVQYPYNYQPYQAAGPY